MKYICNSPNTDGKRNTICSTAHRQSHRKTVLGSDSAFNNYICNVLFKRVIKDSKLSPVFKSLQLCPSCSSVEWHFLLLTSLRWQKVSVSLHNLLRGTRVKTTFTQECSLWKSASPLLASDNGSTTCFLVCILKRFGYIWSVSQLRFRVLLSKHIRMVKLQAENWLMWFQCILSVCTVCIMVLASWSPPPHLPLLTVD